MDGYLVSVGNVSVVRENPVCIINKDGNPSTISTRHVEANVNMQDENQHYRNSTNEVEDLNALEHPLSQIS